jgi:hypothetical protein
VTADNQFRSSVMDLGRGVEPDARMAVVVVVPVEEPSTVSVGVFEGAEVLREVGPVLEGPEMAFDERVDAPIDVKSV